MRWAAARTSASTSVYRSMTPRDARRSIDLVCYLGLLLPFLIWLTTVLWRRATEAIARGEQIRAVGVESAGLAVPHRLPRQLRAAGLQVIAEMMRSPCDAAARRGPGCADGLLVAAPLPVPAAADVPRLPGRLRDDGRRSIFGYLTFGPAFVFQFTEKVEDVASNYVLAAVPLFVFMGAMLERSGIAEQLFEAIHLWTRRLPGGLAVGTVIMCIIFAASTGVVGATETVVGLLAIPVMMRYRYNKELISARSAPAARSARSSRRRSSPS